MGDALLVRRGGSRKYKNFSIEATFEEESLSRTYKNLDFINNDYIFTAGIIAKYEGGGYTTYDVSLEFKDGNCTVENVPTCSCHSDPVVTVTVDTNEGTLKLEHRHSGQRFVGADLITLIK